MQSSSVRWDHQRRCPFDLAAICRWSEKLARSTDQHELTLRLTRIELKDNYLVMKLSGYAHDAVNLDAIFAALADPTRRSILARLAAGEASVNEIAAPFSMSQPAVSKHLRVLERAGLIERDVDKQRRPARLKAQPMAAAVNWLDEFKQFWSSSFGELDGLLDDLKKSETKEARE